jgi:phosphate uptake regulator
VLRASKGELRRLVKIGRSIYVSLPRGWVESRGLGSGSVLVAETVEGGLLLRPLGDREEAKVRRIEGGGVRDVVKAYLAGYDVIEVEKPADDLLKGGLEKLLKLLVGLEVVEESGSKLVLQCFIKGEYDVKGVLSRMDSLSRSMYVDAAAALESGDAAALESVRARDDKLDRLYFLAVRLIRSSIQSPEIGAQSRLFLVDARLAAKILEEVGDEAERMTYSEPAKGLVDAARKVAEYQESVVASFLRGRCYVERAPPLEPAGSPGAGGWTSLLRIRSLVSDLAELT